MLNNDEQEFLDKYSESSMRVSKQMFDLFKEHLMALKDHDIQMNTEQFCVLYCGPLVMLFAQAIEALTFVGQQKAPTFDGMLFFIEQLKSFMAVNSEFKKETLQ